MALNKLHYNMITPDPSWSSGESNLTIANSTELTTATNLLSNTNYRLNSTGSAFQVTMPDTPSIDDKIVLWDYVGKASLNNVTVNMNGKKFIGQLEDFIFDKSFSKINFIYVNETIGWSIYGN